jgi:dUTP pyrophosphatase
MKTAEEKAKECIDNLIDSLSLEVNHEESNYDAGQVHALSDYGKEIYKVGFLEGQSNPKIKQLKTMKVQRIRDVKLPTRGTPQSAGLDFYVPNDVLFGGIDICLKPGDSVVIPSGIKVEVPKGYALIGFNKSGIAVKRHLYVGACVIDEDYQGEVHIHLTNVGKDASYISPGDKIAQFILVPVLYADIEEVDELHKVPTERGTGAFGSTDDKDNLK